VSELPHRNPKPRSVKGRGGLPAAGKPAGTGRATARPAAAGVDLGPAVITAFLTNERMNQFLLEHLDARAWAAPPPLVKPGAGRTIAAIVAHMHNVRGMWLKVSARGVAAPEKLDRTTVTMPEARRALAASGKAIRALIESALQAGGKVKEFRPDVVGFLGYVVAHEAHHRGQICMQARQLGYPLAQEVNFGLWDWAGRWKESGGQG
jgi:uncharacterized damage-inducible protein DinB